MPVRARRPKRRTSEAADLEVWETLFETGMDLYSDLESALRYGPRSASEHAVVREAWRRLGARFLAARREAAEQWVREVPWALETYGEPPCR